MATAKGGKNQLIEKNTNNKYFILCFIYTYLIFHFITSTILQCFAKNNSRGPEGKIPLSMAITMTR